MPEYKAPLEDMFFALNDVLDSKTHYEKLGANDATPDMIEAICTEGAKFAEQVLSPLNSVGDEQGCTLKDGVVTAPDGFKEAYQQYVENGWPSLSQPEKWGGQGLPESLGMMVGEMNGSANWSWAMYPGLSSGAMDTLELHGTDEQKETYLTKLVSGEWTGTMCLTEPQCGSDLGILKTKALANDDGSYRISGSKIFISAGDHDLAENIVHIVLARLPGAPEGTKGISLFIVPKMIDGQSNKVVCSALEHKMGIHGNATCVINFDEAEGYLIGPENRGLHCMFTFMNFARVGTAQQGVAAAELSYQGAVAYAKDRLAMRSLTGTKYPDKVADPIIVHPDVRRMLMTQKSIVEGGRMMIYYTTFLVDIVKNGDAETAKDADKKLGYITPILKAFLTETGYEAANLGVQVFGGHGYIKEWGMEQIVRDTRISMLYEGTTGIQALDLLGRKVLGDRGATLKVMNKEIQAFCKEAKKHKPLKKMAERLVKQTKELGWMTMKLGIKAGRNRDEVGGASVDYLMYSGYTMMAYMWLKMAVTAQEKLDAGQGNASFYEAKIKTCEFYYQRMLTRTRGHKDAINHGCNSIMALNEDQFIF